MRVVQMGLQRTGTNAARALVEANLGIQVDSRNKHRAPTRSFQPGEGALVTFRPPAEWCWAVYRYRKNKYAHITPPVPIVFSKAFIDDALEEWVHVASRQLYAALAPPRQPAVVLNHKTVVHDPARVVHAVAEMIGVRPPRELLLFDGYAKRGGPEVRGADLIDHARPFNRTAATDGSWRGEVPADLLQYLDDAAEAAATSNPLLHTQTKIT